MASKSLKEMKEKGVSAIPVLLLTARDSVEDRVKGLDTGADDYLTKPFAFEELHGEASRANAAGRLRTADTKVRRPDARSDYA